MLSKPRRLTSVVNGLRQCITCKVRKPLTEFYRHSQNPNTTQSNCKICTNNQSIERRKIPGYSRRIRQRFHIRKYGLTIERFNEIVSLQYGGCAICGSTKGGTRYFDERLHIDHDHKTGAVRGLLCNFCNSGIGSFRDNPQLMEKAIIYLNARKDYRNANINSN